MSRNKFEVTVSGWFKLLATIVLLGFSGATVLPASPAAGVSMLAYSLMFVFLAVNGSNSKIAAWIADRKAFMTVFFMPTVVCAFYSAVIYFSSVDNDPRGKTLAAFGALLTILSIPFSFVLIRVQGGIRRWNAFAAFVAFPISLYVLCMMFPEKAAIAAGGATVVVFLIFFIFAVVQNIRDHRADDASGSDKARAHGYVAKWDGKPDSNVSNNIIHLRGTIIVEYSGQLDKSYASDVVRSLIQTYVARVARDMPGYSVNDANVTVRYEQVG